MLTSVGVVGCRPAVEREAADGSPTDSNIAAADGERVVEERDGETRVPSSEGIGGTTAGEEDKPRPAAAKEASEQQAAAVPRPGQGGAPRESSPASGRGGEAQQPVVIDRRLSPALLDKSLELGRRFLLANQTSRGNFRYAFNGETGEIIGQDNQVRQAGALWGLALVHRALPSEESEQAVRRGLEFYRLCSSTTREGAAFIEYPGGFEGETGMVALVALAALEFLEAADEAADVALERRQLEGYLQFLLAMRRTDGHFHREYRWGSGLGIGLPSPYFDGEALLALVRASHFTEREALRAPLMESAEAMHRAYVVEARRAESDSDLTKGFFQWGMLAQFEMVDAGWPGTEDYPERVIEMAHWMIDTHRMLERKRNTAYAVEGLVCAWELARRTGDTRSQARIGAAIDEALYQLTTWQFGSPVANDFLQGLSNPTEAAAGGVMNARDDPRLRIDTTQHQMHAVILARRYIYR